MTGSFSDARVVRRRLLMIGSTYLLAVLVSGLVLRAGVSAARIGADPMSVPWLVVGAGGVLGGAVVTAAALYARRALRRNRDDPTPLDRAVLWARLGRVLMLVAAVLAVVLGVLLAPDDEERVFALVVNTLLAALLAAFALLANDLDRLRARTQSSTGPTP